MSRKHQRHSHIEAGGDTKTALIPIEQGAQPAHEDIARLAYALWEERGHPDGSPQEDWYHAEAEIRSGANSSYHQPLSGSHARE